MTEYIKKAVELADGFEWDIERDAIVYTQYGQMNFAKDEPIFLDHLAAQLTRQVDALDRWIIDIQHDGTDILDDYDRGRLQDQILGPDRTMNTIRAIVDSSVLEKGLD